MKKNHLHIKALLLACICAATTAFSASPAIAGASAGIAPGTVLQQVQSPITGTAEAPNGASTNTAAGTPTLWVVGDSTAAEFQDTTYYSPRYGWGTQLGLYIQGIDIRNLAVSGASSKSYLETDQYQILLQNLNMYI